MYCNPVSEMTIAAKNIYSGGVYYDKTGRNRWLMKFVVVQNIRVFLKVDIYNYIFYGNVNNDFNYYSLVYRK